MPKDTIPWLMTRKSRKKKPCNDVIKLYRPTTNKTYKIVLPEINGMVCLYSKDGWLLLYKLKRYRDLNLKRGISPMKMIDMSDMSHNVTVYKNELFAFSRMETFEKQISNVYKFDHFSMDWVTDDDGVSNMIWFNNRLNDDIGFVVKEECTEARRTVFLNGLKLQGCQVIPSTEEVYHKTCRFKFVYDFTLNNMLGYSNSSFMERELQIKSREERLLKVYFNGDIIRKEFASFFVYGKKQGIWNWVNVA
ncbi:hypothetical protein FRX31_031375 [Thalictrum thalictroides]|uniref:Uncharacterized protein n=1 Tax=Thalictrum thalictroides TaxID=46969 RepID=A0A7J6V3M0_THATH|nr:hypothetical protein FRX31_031375 [Thalictrum thalictroides]